MWLPSSRRVVRRRPASVSRVAACGMVLGLALLSTARAQDKARADDTGRLYFSVDVGMNFYLDRQFAGDTKVDPTCASTGAIQQGTANFSGFLTLLQIKAYLP